MVVRGVSGVQMRSMGRMVWGFGKYHELGEAL
jgi:hypothetical protein